jgi:hypothetical protein
MVETNKQKFNKRYKQPLDQSNSLADIARLSGISKSILNNGGLPGFIRLLLEVKPEQLRIRISGKNIKNLKNNIYY